MLFAFWLCLKGTCSWFTISGLNTPTPVCKNINGFLSGTGKAKLKSRSSLSFGRCFLICCRHLSRMSPSTRLSQLGLFWQASSVYVCGNHGLPHVTVHPWYARCIPLFDVPSLPSQAAGLPWTILSGLEKETDFGHSHTYIHVLIWRVDFQFQLWLFTSLPLLLQLTYSHTCQSSPTWEGRAGRCYGIWTNFQEGEGYSEKLPSLPRFLLDTSTTWHGSSETTFLALRRLDGWL